MHLKKLQFLSDDYPTAEHYPFNIELFRSTAVLDFKSNITFFVGENGTGKSTLLQAIARRCDIHLWTGIDRSTSEYNPYEGALFMHIAATWNDKPVTGAYFGADSFGHYARIIDEWASLDPGVLAYYGGDSLLKKSHGQCNMAYFKSRFDIEGLYLLDEPETALSPTAQIELLQLLKSYRDTGRAQFIVSTHSPILLALPGADLLCFDGPAIVPTRYEDTDYYKVYRDFLNHRDKYLG